MFLRGGKISNLTNKWVETIDWTKFEGLLQDGRFEPIDINGVITNPFKWPKINGSLGL